MKKDRICKDCGELCYGSKCAKCNKKKKYSNLARRKALKTRFDKTVMEKKNVTY